MPPEATLPDASAIEGKIRARQFTAALEDLALLLQADPTDTNAMYMTAVCHRYNRDFDKALQTLDTLLALAPEHGRAWQEAGHNRRDQANPGAALESYRRACQLNPALVASWRSQFAILEQQGARAEAAQVRAQLAYLEQLPAPLLAVMDLISDGKLLKAEDICRQFLQQAPKNVDGMRMLADIGTRLGVLDDAEFLLASALKFEPDNIRVRIDYVQILRKRQKFEAARDEAAKLMAASPDNPQFQSMYAIESMQCGEFETALEHFDGVLAKMPGEPTTLTSKGHALKTSGRYDDAVECYRNAIASRSAYGEAWYSLANLKVYEFSDQEIGTMRELENRADLGHMDRVHLCFALGKAYEDRQAFADSFGFYERGNALKKVQSRYSADTMTADLAKQKSVCTAEFFADRGETGHPAPDPIFILGLPRAGSTLLEQILSSHSQIDGTLELPNILSLSQRLRRRSRSAGTPEYPEILASLPAEELAEFGEEFIRDTRIHRGDAPFFIDKMPNNFRHIGLIRLILPNAKVIDARREPMACCFSGFKQLFAEGQEFSYDLADLGTYYHDYVDLMDHWDEVLPGFVLRVNHEDVVDDLEHEVRRMLDFCGLPFEDACVRYYETERSVRTPSSEQVRKPISRSGLAQWKNYDEWLDPLREALGSNLQHSGS